MIIDKLEVQIEIGISLLDIIKLKLLGISLTDMKMPDRYR